MTYFKKFVGKMAQKNLCSTPYHSQTNKSAEGTNAFAVNIISMFVDERPNNWDLLLPLITFVYNTSFQNSSFQNTSFRLLYERDPMLPIDN